MNQRQRPEPGLGEIDGLDTEVERRPASTRKPTRTSTRTRRRRRATAVWLLLALVTASAAAVYTYREELRSHFPGSETRELLNAAARAELEANWHGNPQNNDALALYRRVLETDPDNDVARLGLRRVGDRIAEKAEQAIDANEVDEADHLIELLAQIGMPGDRVLALRGRVERQRVAGHELADLLAQARDAQTRGDIRGNAGALAKYQHMLALDPDNAVALRGIEDALGVLIQDGIRAAAEGRLGEAERLAESVAIERPQHVGLPPLRQAIQQARLAELEREAEAEREREQALAQAQAEAQRQANVLAAKRRQADADLAEGRLDEALRGYRQVLSHTPDDSAARRGQAQIAEAALEQARVAIAESDAPRAEVLLRLAARAEADTAQLADSETDLQALNERLTAVLARPDLDAEAERRLAALMARAREAEERGELVEPVGASAYDLYRQVLAVDPMHEDARRATVALPRRAQSLVVHRTELGQLDAANDAIHALQAMAPMDPSLPELRRQLATAWLERGSSLVRTGADAEARRALERARALAPSHPGVAALARELAGG